MSLLEIKNFLLKNKTTSLKALALHFKCDSEFLRQMLRHWVAKGSVRCFKKTPACGSRCNACPEAQVELYEWVAGDLC